MTSAIVNPEGRILNYLETEDLFSFIVKSYRRQRAAAR